VPGRLLVYRTQGKTKVERLTHHLLGDFWRPLGSRMWADRLLVMALLSTILNTDPYELACVFQRGVCRLAVR
jgi:hypothetical protein